MLISSIYTTSPHTRSLKPVRVPSDQNTRWRLSFPPSTDKRQEFITSLYLPDTLMKWNIAATPHTCDIDHTASCNTRFNMKYIASCNSRFSNYCGIDYPASCNARIISYCGAYHTTSCNARFNRKYIASCNSRFSRY